jgi:hypothetical protein
MFYINTPCLRICIFIVILLVSAIISGWYPFSTFLFNYILKKIVLCLTITLECCYPACNRPGG